MISTWIPLKSQKTKNDYNSRYRGTEGCAENNDPCRGMKSRAEHNRLENQSCRGTNSRTIHSRLENHSSINGYVREVCARTQISYCEAVSLGLT